MSRTDSGDSYAEFAGNIVWPRSAAELTDTSRCPACRSLLRSPLCSTCGLDLRHPASTLLLTASTDAAAAFDRRRELIGRIRFDVAEARSAAQPAAATDVPAPAAIVDPVMPTTPPRPAFQPTGASAVPPAPTFEPPRTPAAALPPAPASIPAAPRRSSVQILLLLVGVTLVSVAAIFFLTVAWLFAGLEVRSAIIALFTVAALVTAGALRRRRLVATAEGIGVLAIVLVLLDAWALRANDLFGLAAADGPAYWGVTLSACTALFLGWHALSGLRVASVAGFALAAPGLGLLAAGLAAGQPGETRLYLGFLGAAVGALLHHFTLPSPAALPTSPSSPGAVPVAAAVPVAGARHRSWPALDRVPERLALLTLAALALIGAGLTAPLVNDTVVLAPLWTLGAVAVAALLHLLVILPRADAAAPYRLFAYGAAALFALAVTTIAPIVASRAESLTLVLILPILIAVMLSLAAELFARRRAAGPVRTAAIVAGATAAVVAANAAILVVAFAAWPLGVAVLSGLAATDEPIADTGADNAWALGTLAAVGALTGLAWALGGILKPRRGVVASLFMGVAVLLVPFAGPLAVVTVLYALLGTLALAVLLLNRRGRLPLGTFGPVIVAFLILAETFGYVISWHSSTTWWIGSVSAILTLFLARLLLDQSTAAAGRGILLAGAIALTVVAALVTPWALTLATSPSETTLIVDGLRALALVTGLLQLAVAFPAGRILTDTERRWAFWTLLAPTVAAVALPVTGLAESLQAGERAALLLGSPALSIVPTALLLGAIGIWLGLRGNPGTARIERFVALGTAAPTLLALTWSVRQATDASASVDGISVATAALLVCAVGLTGHTLGARDKARGARAGTDRLALEAGATLVLVPGTLIMLAGGSPFAWLVLLLAGVTALVTAVSPDGLFGSLSPRRHLGWLALLLGTAGLWLGLYRSGAETLEPYVLPVAGVLLVLAVLMRRFGRNPRADTASPVAALLTLAGLLVAIVPLALASASGYTVRPIVIAAVCAVLLLGAGAVRWAPPGWAYLAAAWASGAIGLLVTSVVQLVRVLGEPGAPDARLEFWLLPLAVSVAGTFLLATRTDPVTLRPRRIAGITVLVLVLVTVTAAEVGAFAGVGASADGAVSAVRASVLVLALGVAHVLAVWRPRAPLSVATGWVAAGLAGFAVVFAVRTEATKPFELVTVALGLAIVVGQVLAGRARPVNPDVGARVTGARDTAAPVAGQTRWITAGLALALLPSAVVGGTGDLLRPVLALALGGAFAVGGALLLARPRWSFLAWPTLGIGALTVVLAADARIQPLLETTPNGPDIRLEAWLLPAALIVLTVGTILVAVIRRADAGAVMNRGGATDVPVLRLGYGLVVLAMVGVLAAEVLALGYAPLAPIRVILLAWTFSALHLAAFWYDESRLGRLVAWVAIGAGGIAVVAGFAQSAPDTVEIVSVPLAIALLATGWLHLDVAPAARSRRWLTSGLLVLLVPSLLLDFTESPLWRVVGLGLVATVVIVVGAVGKLQAPFVIGAVVLLAHAVAQLWPWISLAYGAVPWWLWLGVGGVILIVLAARYEQRIANFKAIALNISALR